MSWNPSCKLVSIPYQDTIGWPQLAVGLPPPSFPSSHSFTRYEIAFSTARNMAKSTVRPAVTRTLARNASNLLRALVDRHALELMTLPDLDHLGDQALNAFADDVAVGIAGLCMERAGFIWRAHAKEVLPVARRPDYVWTQTLAATGVTLSEVKGMAGSSRSFSTLKARVHEAFDEQVDPWKLGSTSSGTPITGGYAIGVRVSHSQAAEVAAVRSVPTPSLPGSLHKPPPLPLPFGPDPMLVRQHYASALALMGLGGMSRRIAGLPYLPSPDIQLDFLQAEDMRFVARRDRRARLVVGMDERAFRFAMMLEATAPIDPARLFDRPVPPSYEARAEDYAMSERARPLQVLAPDGLGLIDRSGGVANIGRFWWTAEGADF